jgi:hypothetical protein
MELPDPRREAGQFEDTGRVSSPWGKYGEPARSRGNLTDSRYGRGGGGTLEGYWCTQELPYYPWTYRAPGHKLATVLTVITNPWHVPDYPHGGKVYVFSSKM